MYLSFKYINYTMPHCCKQRMRAIKSRGKIDDILDVRNWNRVIRVQPEGPDDVH